jgi:hypothetical protein
MDYPDTPQQILGAIVLIVIWLLTLRSMHNTAPGKYFPWAFGWVALILLGAYMY